MPIDPKRSGRQSGLLGLSKSLDGILNAVERVTLVVSCISVAVIMVFVFIDGSMRYLVNSPLQFVSDAITLYLISAAFLLVLSYSLRHGSHISVDLFAHMMNNRLQNVLTGAGMLCAAPAVAIMVYGVTGATWDAWVQGEALVGLYPFPVWPSKALVAAGLIILDVRLVHLGLFNLLAGITGDESLAYPLAPVEAHPEEEMV